MFTLEKIGCDEPLRQLRPFQKDLILLQVLHFHLWVMGKQ
jgi:hypothetical protein